MDKLEGCQLRTPVQTISNQRKKKTKQFNPIWSKSEIGEPKSNLFGPTGLYFELARVHSHPYADEILQNQASEDNEQLLQENDFSQLDCETGLNFYQLHDDSIALGDRTICT